jgi:hypothetical protein
MVAAVENRGIRVFQSRDGKEEAINSSAFIKLDCSCQFFPNLFLYTELSATLTLVYEDI